jgi:hypothetical protein
MVAVRQALASPTLQEAAPVIAQPAENSAVRDVVQIIGSATHPQFQRYELYYAPFPVPSDQAWIFIGDAKFNQQPLGLLGTWDSRSVPDGSYALRVRVVKQDGNYLDSGTRRVLVANTRPLPSPTPSETSTPEPEPTELPTVAAPSPTIVVAVPTIAVPTVRPSATPEPASTSILPSGSSASGPSSGQPSRPEEKPILAPEQLIETAKKSALYTVAFFGALAAFFAVKAVLAWLWNKARP